MAKLSFGTAPPFALAVALWIREAASGVIGLRGMAGVEVLVVMVVPLDRVSAGGGMSSSSPMAHLVARHDTEGIPEFYRCDQRVQADVILGGADRPTRDSQAAQKQSFP